MTALINIAEMNPESTFARELQRSMFVQALRSRSFDQVVRWHCANWAGLLSVVPESVRPFAEASARKIQLRQSSELCESRMLTFDEFIICTLDSTVSDATCMRLCIREHSLPTRIAASAFLAQRSASPRTAAVLNRVRLVRLPDEAHWSVHALGHCCKGGVGSQIHPSVLRAARYCRIDGPLCKLLPRFPLWVRNFLGQKFLYLRARQFDPKHRGVLNLTPEQIIAMLDLSNARRMCIEDGSFDVKTQVLFGERDQLEALRAVYRREADPAKASEELLRLLLSIWDTPSIQMYPRSVAFVRKRLSPSQLKGLVQRLQQRYCVARTDRGFVACPGFLPDLANDALRLLPPRLPASVPSLPIAAIAGRMFGSLDKQYRPQVEKVLCALETAPTSEPGRRTDSIRLSSVVASHEVLSVLYNTCGRPTGWHEKATEQLKHYRQSIESIPGKHQMFQLVRDATNLAYARPQLLRSALHMVDAAHRMQTALAEEKTDVSGFVLLQAARRVNSLLARSGTMFENHPLLLGIGGVGSIDRQARAGAMAAVVGRVMWLFPNFRGTHSLHKGAEYYLKQIARSVGRSYAHIKWEQEQQAAAMQVPMS